MCHIQCYIVCKQGLLSPSAIDPNYSWILTECVAYNVLVRNSTQRVLLFSKNTKSLGSPLKCCIKLKFIYLLHKICKNDVQIL